jgi:ubiquitin-conjugating enzyme E2 D/E
MGLLKPFLEQMSEEELEDLYKQLGRVFINMLLGHTAYVVARQILREIQQKDKVQEVVRSDEPQGQPSTLTANSPTAMSTKVLPLDETGWGFELKRLREIDRQCTALPSDPNLHLYKGIAARLQLEMVEVFKTPFLSARFIEHDSFHLRLSFVGPPQSLYKGGVFHLAFRFTDYYPFMPPTVRFLTRVYHPNINSSGEICMDNLERKLWSPAMQTSRIAVSIVSLLSDPFPNDPLVPEIAATYLADRETYASNVRAFTKRHAGPGQNYPEFGVLPEYFAEQTGSEGSGPKEGMSGMEAAPDKRNGVQERTQ